MVNLDTYGEDDISFEDRLLLAALDDEESRGESTLTDTLYESEYVRTPPTFEEFIGDDYYLRDVCERTEDQMGLIPMWREQLGRFYAPNSKKRLMVLSGAIGTGKTFCAGVGLLYRLARILCMRNPMQYYGISRATSIVFSIISITMDQVGGGAYSDIGGMMGLSPFFKEHLSLATDKTKKKTRFAQRVGMDAGSKARHAIGRNVIATLIDEINFRIEKNPAQVAKDLVNALEARGKSRFRHTTDQVTFLVSSANNDTDFLADFVRKSRSNPEVMICEFPYWETMGPMKIRYSGVTFPVDKGDSLNEPKVLDESEVHLVPAERIINIPIEHRTEFEPHKLIQNLKDVAGVGIGKYGKFFSDPIKLMNCVKDGIRNPMKADKIPLGISSEHKLSDFVDMDILLRHNRPRFHPESPRFVAIDVATGAMDALGFAMIHPVFSVQVDHVNTLTEITETRMAPVFQMDMAFRVVREKMKPKDPIDFAKVRQFIGWLRSNGFMIALVSCDLDLLSKDMRNILTQNGFNTEYFSMDKKKDGYYVMRQLIDEGRFYTFNNKHFFLEASNLEDTEKKVDHPETNTIEWGDYFVEPGSKDVTDAVGQAIFHGEAHAGSFNLPSMYIPVGMFDKTIHNAPGGVVGREIKTF